MTRQRKPLAHAGGFSSFELGEPRVKAHVAIGRVHQRAGHWQICQSPMGATSASASVTHIRHDLAGEVARAVIRRF